mmetsp:Transcript_29093/g.93080  ORF Transcript_29093/g.93080 Transcript_29093/m.93080 type:complete len:361 (-) Transcript_29093:73-1155(-)
MEVCANTHAQLEARRDDAMARKSNGPRVLIVGPMDAGKSTLSKILAGYAVRIGRSPILVDLDVGQGAISVPGTIACVPLDSGSLKVDEESVRGNPLTYFYGHTSLAENVEYYNYLVKKLGESIDNRCRIDTLARTSGCIINTCGWVEGAGLESLKVCANNLRVDVVLVLGEDRLYVELKNSMPSTVTVVKLPRSGGVVTRSRDFRRITRNARIREYFYGPPLPKPSADDPAAEDGAMASVLAPCLLEVSLDAVKIYRAVDAAAAAAAAAALPMGFGDKDDDDEDDFHIAAVEVEPSDQLLYSILGVVHAEDEGDVLLRNCAGFIHVTAVNLEKRVMSVLAPCPGALPSGTLLLGTIKWMD